jgi:HTH-type transcriptional regulator / antitoxin HigA
MELVEAFPLRPILDEGQLEAALDIIDQLLDREELSHDEQDYLEVLSVLVERYEADHVQIPPVSGVEVLRFLMQEHDLKQVDLVPMFGSKSIVSEVLSGKRGLSLNHIRKLSRHFHLPADAFLDGDL